MNNNSYYSINKHQYMNYKDDIFGRYIYSLIYDESFNNYDTAVELGAGMGRFSYPVVSNFSKVTLVEPVNSYANTLREKFSNNDIRVMEISAEEFLSNHAKDKPVIIFCFHLMHHLKTNQRKEIYQYVRRTGSKGIFIEPNPFNPLILLQILLNPDMHFSEEMQYVTLTRRKYMKELKDDHLVLVSFKRFCFLPPFVTNFILKKFPRKVVRFFEIFNKVLPFLSSYQMITCLRENQ